VARFQSFWFGDDVPVYQRLAMKSFIDHGHEYVLYAYKILGAPAGVILRDASEILPASSVFFYGERAGVGRGSVAGFANLFRYHLLCRLGGWWVDADVICLSEAVPDTEIFVGWEYPDLLGNAILKFPASHELVEALRDQADGVGPDVAWGTTGPSLLTRLLTERNLLDVATPQPLAYPIQSIDALHLLMPQRRAEVEERIRNRPFLHFWNEVFRRAVIFPWMAPPAGSVMAALLDRHHVSFGGAPTYTADEVRRLNDNFCAFVYQQS
jgi:hypothetical protein